MKEIIMYETDTGFQYPTKELALRHERLEHVCAIANKTTGFTYKELLELLGVCPTVLDEQWWGESVFATVTDDGIYGERVRKIRLNSSAWLTDIALDDLHYIELCLSENPMYSGNYITQTLKEWIDELNDGTLYKMPSPEPLVE